MKKNQVFWDSRHTNSLGRNIPDDATWSYMHRVGNLICYEYSEFDYEDNVRHYYEATFDVDSYRRAIESMQEKSSCKLCGEKWSISIRKLNGEVELSFHGMSSSRSNVSTIIKSNHKLEDLLLR